MGQEMSGKGATMGCADSSLTCSRSGMDKATCARVQDSIQAAGGRRVDPLAHTSAATTPHLGCIPRPSGC